MTTPKNQAAWLSSPKANPLIVAESPFSRPSAGEVLIKNAALAINPVDNKIQDLNIFNLPTPLILGIEVAGEVIEIGDGVTNVKVGDRVIG